MSWTSRSGSGGAPSSSRSRRATARTPDSNSGWWIVVRPRWSASSRSSYPVTDRSCGTRSPSAAGCLEHAGRLGIARAHDRGRRVRRRQHSRRELGGPAAGVLAGPDERLGQLDPRRLEGTPNAGQPEPAGRERHRRPAVVAQERDPLVPEADHVLGREPAAKHIVADDARQGPMMRIHEDRRQARPLDPGELGLVGRQGDDDQAIHPLGPGQIPEHRLTPLRRLDVEHDRVVVGLRRAPPRSHGTARPQTDGPGTG